MKGSWSDVVIIVLDGGYGTQDVQMHGDITA